MPDASILAPLLASGQYDTYMKELMDQTYGPASTSPYLRNALTSRAQDIVSQAQMQAVMNSQTPDINAVTDPSTISTALMEAMNRGRAGQNIMPQTRDTGVKFLARLAELSQQDPSSPGAMLAEVVYNDPKLMQSMMMSSLPEGYGGIFGPGLKRQMQDRLYTQYYRPPQSGNYFTDLQNLMAGFSGSPRGTAPVGPASPGLASSVLSGMQDQAPMSAEEKAALLDELSALGQ
jgi:hypothetical protein